MIVNIVMLFFALTLMMPTAFAGESIGTLSIDNVRLRAEFLSLEEQGADFNLQDSAFAVEWRKDNAISAYLAIGSELSRNLPIYYNAIQQDRVGFYEAYGEFRGVYGTVQFGLIPLKFGYDGALSDDERLFNRAQPYSQRLIGLRDFGLSFSTENKGYYTMISAHNGEVDTESDGRVWATANWGYTNSRNFKTQLSLQSGSVKATQSTGSTNTIAGVDNTISAKWSNALLFMNWYPRQWNVVVQVGGGELEQTGIEGGYLSNMFEATRYFSKNFGTGFRYDQFDPNKNINGDKITEASLALVFKSSDSTSEIVLSGTKVTEEGNEVTNDQFRLVWLLTPVSH
jgi:hypothetical protein